MKLIATLSAISLALPLFAQNPVGIWELESSNFTTTIKQALSGPLFINNLDEAWSVSFNGSPVIFHCWREVAGSSENAPWTSNFTPLRSKDPGWDVGFSGSIVVPANSFACVNYTFHENKGAEVWENKPGHYFVSRNHDARIVTAIGTWQFFPIAP